MLEYSLRHLASLAPQTPLSRYLSYVDLLYAELLVRMGVLFPILFPAHGTPGVWSFLSASSSPP